MKKILAVIVFVLVSGTLFSETSIAAPPPSAMQCGSSGEDIRIGVEPLIGFYFGKIREYVFDNGYKMSELDWEIRHLFVSGVSANCFLFDRLFVSAGLVQGINDDIGKIEDSDWTDYSGNKTNYSRHDNTLEKALFADAKIGRVFRPTDGIDLKTYLGYGFFDIKMQARDGYLEYPPGSAPEQLYGAVMEYEQKYRIPYVGVGCGYRFEEIYYAGVFLNFTQYASCSAIDNHFLRSIDFYDTMRKMVWVESGLVFEVRASERAVVRSTVSCTMTKLKKGSEYYIETDTGIRSATIDDSAGTKMIMNRIELSAEIKIP